MRIYLARGIREGKAQPEDDEAIEVKFFSLAAAIKMIRNQKIRDAKTIAPVLWLELSRSK
jgi:ADP-ribose pyrophosphatase